MTDYGQFYDEQGRLKSDDEQPKSQKKARCSTNKSLQTLIKYAVKLNKLRKEAADAGICLDELEDVAKELANI